MTRLAGADDERHEALFSHVWNDTLAGVERGLQGQARALATEPGLALRWRALGRERFDQMAVIAPTASRRAGDTEGFVDDIEPRLPQLGLPAAEVRRAIRRGLIQLGALIEKAGLVGALADDRPAILGACLALASDLRPVPGAGTSGDADEVDWLGVLGLTGVGAERDDRA